MGKDIRVGKLWCHVRDNRASATFEYDKKYLEHPERFTLEPLLFLNHGFLSQCQVCFEYL
jgi:hypothetical protein